MLNIGFIWALVAALPCVQTLMAQYSNRNIIITPPQKLSEGVEDNEIVILRNKVAFVDRTSKDTCAVFHFEKHNPYYKSGLPELRRPIGTIEKGVYERFDLGGLTKKEIVKLYGLQNTPAPIPDDFKFGGVLLRNFAVGVSNIAVVQFSISFHSWCSPNQEHNCGYELLLAHKNTFIALNNKGEVIWSWLDYHNCADLELTENGKYLGINYGGIAEDYAGDYFWPTGIQIVETATLTTIFKQDLDQIMPFIAHGNIFWLTLYTKESLVMVRFEPEKHVVYSLAINKEKWSPSAKSYKDIERGFIWEGKTYLWDRDFKQTPFNQPLKLQQP